ncbi:universal stress protein [Histidinibacterium aquaticum]|uniref:Universal stress protein n=1 Tax=Histidinibacterium aquaticum TaxID=2613962 RepID=A0A5J5GEU5_9RHOB|nr:universal stress protein [Histidinibacterium aquaticum]KAA9006695.1 universal stress protein [Histidinibacterium aquaticum]
MIQTPAARPNQLFGHVLACLDRSPLAATVLREAKILAELSEARLSALRVIPSHDPRAEIADPVDWELRRREEVADLLRLSDEAEGMSEVQPIVTCGSALERVEEEARRVGADLLVIGAGIHGTPHRWGLGGTARLLVEAFGGSVLVVPDELAGEPSRPRRIIVPMDGSPSSEVALRYASAIARGRSAELLVLHALPETDAPRDESAFPTRGSFSPKQSENAEHSAEDRIGQLARLMPAHRSGHRFRRLTGTEPRRMLVKAICEERGELVVLSARGSGNDPDLPIGSTAEYLLSRALAPVLLIRQPETRNHQPAESVPRPPAASWQGR